jgi:hypothetical protein
VKADLSRTTFNRLKHFSRVVAQQGRVQVDADWNEQASIFLYHMRRLAADVIGPAGGPASNLGFGIGALKGAGAGGVADFSIGAGHYYVDGILCELDGTWLPVTLSDSKVTLADLSVDGRLFQRDQYVGLMDADPATKIAPVQARITDIDYADGVLTLTDIAAFTKAGPKQPRLQRITTFLTQPEAVPGTFKDGTWQVYLDVWERLITYVEDDAIREVALNGPDTSARTKVVWQVGLLPTDGNACLTPVAIRERLQPANRGRLRARVRPGPTDTDPCTIDPDASYRGHENQLYRVEIHRGGAGGGAPTFKWSRENGAVVFPISSASGSTVVLESLGRDERFGLAEGDWVEVQDDDSVLANRADPLLKVQSIQRGARRIILSGDIPAGMGKDPAKHALLRRWDQREPESSEADLTLDKTDHAATIPTPAGPGDWLELEDGVEVQFVDGKNAAYRTGDYWLIPARVATGDVEWPYETLPGGTEKRALAKFPDGVTHHYAPLAVATWNGKTLSVASECRLQLPGALPVPLKMTPTDGKTTPPRTGRPPARKG